MVDRTKLGRRDFFTRVGSGVGVLMLAGCDDGLSENPDVARLLNRAETVSRLVQKAVAGRSALAREYTDAEISAEFRANGTTEPSDPDYQRLARNGFADGRLAVGGLVARPLSFSLAELKEMPSRTQITRHDCVEGWSCIGKWKGVRLGTLLDRVGPRPEARYVMFFCADAMDLSGTKYYESIDFDGAYHPQTILAYEMNDTALLVAHGAPLRLRHERQLGYKMAKYIMRIELVADFTQIGNGRGGYWEDQGYEWWAGIQGCASGGKSAPLSGSGPRWVRGWTVTRTRPPAQAGRGLRFYARTGIVALEPPAKVPHHALV